MSDCRSSPPSWLTAGCGDRIGGLPATLAAKAATSTIPIVFISGVDPVEAGLVASLNRPGGNLTGLSNFNMRLIAKRFELLHQVAAARRHDCRSGQPENPATQTIEAEARTAAQALGLRMDRAGCKHGRRN